MAKKVARAGVKRESGWLYFIDKDGDVSRARMVKVGRKKTKPEKVARTSVDQEEGYLYYIDRDGDISKTRMASKSVKSGKVQSTRNPPLVKSKSESGSNEGPQESKIKIFYSYSSKDIKMRSELEKHLSILKRLDLIDEWHDRQIPPGSEWKDAIDRNLLKADIILLLISSDFINTDYCYAKEMNCALERHAKGEAVVIPVILKKCMWALMTFSKLQALPTKGKPITKWSDRDEAWTNVAEGIYSVVTALRAKKG